MHPEALQWLNLLLVPTLALLGKISTQLAALDATQREHARRLDSLDSDLQALGRARR
jgi:hypothetical protein